MNIVLFAPLNSFAVTQLDGFFANSFASFDDQLFFANEDGLFVYDKDSDEEVVEAFFELPFSDHGYVGKKKIRSILVDGKISGQIVIETMTSSSDIEEYLTEELDSETGVKIAGMSRQVGRYFSLRVSNVDGSYFSIDKILLVTIRMPERRM